MAKKVIKRILCLYFVVSFIMMVSCLCIVIWDCVEKVCYGEFRLLPVLNVVEFKNAGKGERIPYTTGDEWVWQR